MSYLAGIDIGGTKCAVSLGKQENNGITILRKEQFPTPGMPKETIARLINTLEGILAAESAEGTLGPVPLAAIGISCGSPLDSQSGLILSPPNLPGWTQIDIVTPFAQKYGVPTGLQNDANACALAEWLWGAGQGTKHMIFLTFGTGMGAGLILNGRLYRGANDMAGEVGHIRLAENGPLGNGKEGSFEGFCSGGGIARYGQEKIRAWTAQGKSTAILTAGQSPDRVTALQIGKAAEAGDELALSIFSATARMLGKGLAVLIDVLNPQKIIIGSIFFRQEKLLREQMEAVIREEALGYNREACQVVPAGLGEALGDYAALSVAGSLLLRDI